MLISFQIPIGMFMSFTSLNYKMFMKKGLNLRFIFVDMFIFL
jgi:hypothetical protein